MQNMRDKHSGERLVKKGSKERMGRKRRSSKEMGRKRSSGKMEDDQVRNAEADIRAKASKVHKHVKEPKRGRRKSKEGKSRDRYRDVEPSRHHHHHNHHHRPASPVSSVDDVSARTPVAPPPAAGVVVSSKRARLREKRAEEEAEAKGTVFSHRSPYMWICPVLCLAIIIAMTILLTLFLDVVGKPKDPDATLTPISVQMSLSKDINSGSGSSSPQRMAPFRAGGADNIAMLANDGTHGAEPWLIDTSDRRRRRGLRAARRLSERVGSLVADIYTGVGSSDANYFVSVGQRLYFSATDTNGTELFRYNPDTDVVRQVADIHPSSSSSPSYIVATDKVLYFAANDGVKGTELWQYNTTSKAASLVADINVGAQGSSPRDLAFNKEETFLFFSANNGENGRELWRLNIATGVVKEFELNEGSSGSSVAGLTLFADYIMCGSGQVGSSGIELVCWDTTDMAERGLIRELVDGPGSSNPEYFTALNGDLFFAAGDNGKYGVELWKYDPGNAKGADIYIAADVVSGSGSSNPMHLTAFRSKLFFSADDTSTGKKDAGRRMFAYDPSQGDAVLVLDGNDNSISTPQALFVSGATLFFSVSTSEEGRELWEATI